MNKQIKQLQGLLFAALIGHASAATVSLTSYELNTGYGNVDLNPGTNVTHYVVFGDEQNNASSLPAYAYSSGSNPIASIVAADRSLIYSDYTAGSIGFTGSAGFVASGSTAGKVLKNVLPLSTGYGGSGATNATVSFEAPAADFEFGLMVHNYYAAADMAVSLEGQTLASYETAMSSTGNRDADYLFSFDFSGLTVGEQVEIRFDNLRNLGSAWSNIGFFSATINLETPTQFENGDVTTPPNSVPEPSALILAALSGLGLLLRRRRA